MEEPEKADIELAVQSLIGVIPATDMSRDIPLGDAEKSSSNMKLLIDTNIVLDVLQGACLQDNPDGGMKHILGLERHRYNQKMGNFLLEEEDEKARLDAFTGRHQAEDGKERGRKRERTEKEEVTAVRYRILI